VRLISGNSGIAPTLDERGAHVSQLCSRRRLQREDSISLTMMITTQVATLTRSTLRSARRRPLALHREGFPAPRLEASSLVGGGCSPCDRTTSDLLLA